MKTIQVVIDDALLAELDADIDVREQGRSAVLRRAIGQYLRHKRARQIAAAYREAYSKEKSHIQELDGWNDEGVWPES